MELVRTVPVVQRVGVVGSDTTHYAELLHQTSLCGRVVRAGRRAPRNPFVCSVCGYRARKTSATVL